MDIKERAKVLADNLSLRRFLKGWDCVDKTQSLSSILEKNGELKLYISKLCGTKGKYLLVRDSISPQERLLEERMAFIYSLVTFFLVNSVAAFRYAPQMTAFEVYEVKQSIEDVLEYLANAERLFDIRLEYAKSNLAKKKIAIPASFLGVVSSFHIQKSSNPDVDANDQLYHCYKLLLSEAPAALECLHWRKDQDVFLPLQNFVADQVQKKYLLQAKATQNPRDLQNEIAKAPVHQSVELTQKIDFQAKLQKSNPLSDPKPQEEGKSSRSIPTKDSIPLLDDLKKTQLAETTSFSYAKQDGNRQSIEKAPLSKSPLKEAMLGDSLGPAPAPPKKKKNKKKARTFAAVQ